MHQVDAGAEAHVPGARDLARRLLHAPALRQALGGKNKTSDHRLHTLEGRLLGVLGTRDVRVFTVHRYCWHLRGRAGCASPTAGASAAPCPAASSSSSSSKLDPTTTLPGKSRFVHQNGKQINERGASVRGWNERVPLVARRPLNTPPRGVRLYTSRGSYQPPSFLRTRRSTRFSRWKLRSVITAYMHTKAAVHH